MPSTRTWVVAAAGTLALAVLATPAAAEPSTTADLIDELNGKLLAIAIPITLVTEIALAYAVLQFKDGEAEPTRENRRLEITWTVATAIVLLFVGVASYGVLAQPAVTYTQGMEDPGEDDVVVRAEAYQWNWEMSYPREGNVSTGTTIVLPKGQDVFVRVTSRDVIHGFAVPDLGLKVDALPGQVNVVKTTPTAVGTYQGYCTEYCGAGHAGMTFTVRVVPQDEYEEWIHQQRQGTDNSSSVASDPTTQAGA